MPPRLILASQSPIRARLLAQAGVPVEALPARIDEAAIRTALEAEAATPRDIADTLAEMKARKLAERNPDAVVIGCDQVLEFRKTTYGKPTSPDDARTHDGDVAGDVPLQRRCVRRGGGRGGGGVPPERVRGEDAHGPP